MAVPLGDGPGDVEAAIRSAYPLPETFAAAQAELDYWKQRDQDFGDLLDDQYGNYALDLVAKRRLHIVDRLIDRELEVRTVADVLARVRLMCDRENVLDGDEQDRIIADLERVVAVEAAASSVQPVHSTKSVQSVHFASVHHDGRIADTLRADAARTDRSIAREFGCSPTTVGKVRNALGLADAVRSVLGGFGGAALGTAPLMEVAPFAFGLSKGPLLARAGVSALTGGALNAGDAALRTYGAGGSLPDVIQSAEWPGAFGALGGAAAPAIGDFFAGAANRGVNALARTDPASRLVAGALRDADRTPTQEDATLARMGPQASYADVDPAVADIASANAVLGGGPKSKSVAFFGGAATADDRINDVMTSNLGARPDLKLEEQGIKDARTAAADPYYKAVRASPVPMDVTPIMADIDSQLPTASASSPFSGRSRSFSRMTQRRRACRRGLSSRKERWTAF
jgi:hypothetical protein